MSAGFKYNLNAPKEEELYDVQTGHRKRGPYKLITTGLTVGSELPNLTPVCVDVKARTAVVVKNVKVLADVASNATTVKIAKNSLIGVGDTICDGNKSVAVTAIDKSNASYDSLTIDAAFGVVVPAGKIVYEAKALITGLEVAEATTETGKTVKVGAGSGAYVGMKLTDGTKTVTVEKVVVGDSYDTLTVSAAFGVLAVGTELNETGATAKKNVANFLIYGRTKIESGIVLIALLMQAYEIQEDKLTLPVAEADKVGLTSRFQFE